MVRFREYGTVIDNVTIDMGASTQEAASFVGQRGLRARLTVKGGGNVSVRSCSDYHVDVTSEGAQQRAVYVYNSANTPATDGDGFAFGVNGFLRVRSQGSGVSASGTYSAVEVNGNGCTVDIEAFGSTQYSALHVNGSTVSGRVNGSTVSGRVKGDGTTATVTGIRNPSTLVVPTFDDLTAVGVGSSPGIVSAQYAAGHVTARGTSTGTAVVLTNPSGLRVSGRIMGSGVQGIYISGASTAKVTVDGWVRGVAQSAVLVAADATAAALRVVGLEALECLHGYVAVRMLGGASCYVSRCNVRYTTATATRALELAAGVATDHTFNDFGGQGVQYEASSLVRDTNNVQGTVTTI